MSIRWTYTNILSSKHTMERRHQRVRRLTELAMLWPVFMVSTSGSHVDPIRPRLHPLCELWQWHDPTFAVVSRGSDIQHVGSSLCDWCLLLTLDASTTPHYTNTLLLQSHSPWFTHSTVSTIIILYCYFHRFHKTISRTKIFHLILDIALLIC